MNNYKIVQDALILAMDGHKDQYDKAGLPYIFHPIRVADSLDGVQSKVVALLHDTVEDTNISLRDIENNFGEIIVNAVDAITKRKDEPYKEYLERVNQNSIALTVKIADIADNSSHNRLIKLPIETRIRLVKKYTKAYNYLTTGEWYD